jgi:endonuclease/exonuclease/phosphatase family metal-dependent hydrolase
MGYRIGSFNILKREHKRASNVGRDFFSFIHDFIVDEDLDILALQEVINEDELKNILSALRGLGWHGKYGKPTSRNSDVHGFAFLWNPRRVKPVECSRNQTPRILSEYCSDEYMKRGPLYGRFTRAGVGTNYEFRLINVHLFQSDNMQLRKECGLVTGDIYNRIDVAEREGHYKPVFTLVLGDYNHKQKTCTLITKMFGDQNVETFQDKPTTLKRHEEGFTNNDFDHFSFNTKKNKSVPYSLKCIDNITDYFKDDAEKKAFQKYKELVSDHVPILIELF